MPDVVFSIFHGLRYVRYIVANVSLQRLFSVLNVFLHHLWSQQAPAVRSQSSLTKLHTSYMQMYSSYRAALSYTAGRYDSAVCCSKMSRVAFMSEADTSLEKFV